MQAYANMCFIVFLCVLIDTVVPYDYGQCAYPSFCGVYCTSQYRHFRLCHSLPPCRTAMGCLRVPSRSVWYRVQTRHVTGCPLHLVGRGCTHTPSRHGHAPYTQTGIRHLRCLVQTPRVLSTTWSQPLAIQPAMMCCHRPHQPAPAIDTRIRGHHKPPPYRRMTSCVYMTDYGIACQKAAPISR